MTNYKMGLENSQDWSRRAKVSGNKLNMEFRLSDKYWVI